MAAAALVLAVVAATARGQGRIEAESLARQAVISGGGDLAIVPTPDTNYMPFSGGLALTFVPQGKGAAVTFPVPAGTNVCQVRLRSVVGPSGGVYDVFHGERTVGYLNLGRDRTLHTDRAPGTENGIWTKRIQPEDGVVRLRFVYHGPSLRGGTLVLDSFDIIPVQPPPARAEDPSDGALPAGEKQGPNLIRNGDFEAPARAGPEGQPLPPDGWTLNSSASRRTKLHQVDPAQAHAGNGSLLLAPDPLDDNVIVYQPFKAESGKRYRVAFHARGRGWLRADFYQYGVFPAKAEDTVRGNNNFKVGEAWRLYSLVTSPSASARIHSLALALAGDDASSVSFDDVSVCEILAEPPAAR